MKTLKNHTTPPKDLKAVILSVRYPVRDASPGPALTPPGSQINGSSLVYVDETSSQSASVVILFTGSSKAEVGLCSSRSVAGKG